MTIMNQTYKYELGVPIVANFKFSGESEHQIKFENRKFIWINGDDEYNARIIIPVLSQNDFSYDWRKSEEMKIINRFLTMLTCKIHIPFEISAGHRYLFLKGESEKNRDYCKKSASGYYSLKVADINNNLPESKSMQLALALYREGINSTSVFYKFLNFYKIIELPFKGNYTKVKNQALDWINCKFNEIKKNNISNISSVVIRKDFGNQYLFKMTDDERKKHLYNLCRCAIAHASLGGNYKTRNPDDYSDYYEINNIIEAINDLAICMINSGKVKDEQFQK